MIHVVGYCNDVIEAKDLKVTNDVSDLEFLICDQIDVLKEYV